MESYTLNICNRNGGHLFQHRTKLPKNGPIFTVINKPTLPKKTTYSGSFVHLAVHKNGYQIAASDSTGNIFVFDFKRKKFWRLYHLGIFCCTSLAFAINSELIAGISDCSIIVWNIDYCVKVASASIHKNCVHHISINNDGTRAITSSIEEAIMWDLTSKFRMLYKLTDGLSTYILKAFFLQVTNDIVCAYKTSFVCLWNSESLKYKSKFTCYEESGFWLKAIEGSSDGKIIACGGKSDVIFLWEAETGSLLRKISFQNEFSCVLHILLLSNQYLKNSEENTSSQMISLLDQSGKLYFYNLSSGKYIEHLLINGDEPVYSILEFEDKLVLLMSSGELKLYDINILFEEPMKPKPKTPTTVTFSTFLKSKNTKKGTLKTFSSKKKIRQSSIDLTKMKELLLESNEYPASFRNFIWSQLLGLPRNNEFTNYYNEANPDISSFEINRDKIHESLGRALSKQLHMLIKWCPFLKEIDYLPDLIFPFVQYFNKSARICFELLVTLIRNWCRYWFLYLPFPPYNILYAIENMLIYFDRPLLHHFMKCKISPEVYAFYILKTSFSKIFIGEQWLQLWDHLFSNPPCFILFIVVAFIIISRKTLFQCETVNDFKSYYSQNQVMVSQVLDKAYDLTQALPSCFDPYDIIGPFMPLPKDGYPPLTNFSHLEASFQTLDRKRIIENELNYSFTQNLMTANLEELRNLSKIRESLLLESLKVKDSEKLEEIEKKVRKVQDLVEKNLVPPVNVQILPTERRSVNCIQKINDVLDLRGRLLDDG